MSSNLSRRSFLKGAAALAVVSAASGVLAGCSATGSVSGVTGSGATRTFTDGKNVITVTSTDVNVSSQAGGGLMYVVPTFKVDNKTETNLKFDDDSNSITGYTMVVSASFDGKKPEVKPVKASISVPSTGTGSGDLNLYDPSLVDFTSAIAGDKDITEGVLAFKAPFTNWEKMVVTMTLYKKTDDGTSKVGAATYTFNQ